MVTPPMTEQRVSECGYSKSGGAERRCLAGGRDRDLVGNGCPLLARPAEVRPEGVERQEVDLLTSSLADVADEHRIRRRVDGEPPGVAQPIRDDLGPRAGDRYEWVPGRDRIRVARARVDPEDAAEEIVERLAGHADRDRRRVGAAVTDADVEVPVGAELHHPAVVVGGRLRQREDEAPPRLVGHVGIRGGAVVLDQSDVPVAVVVVRVHEAARRVVGREGDRQQSLLAVCNDDAAKVEERRVLLNAILDQRHHAVLLDHHQPRLVSRGCDDVDGGGK